MGKSNISVIVVESEETVLNVLSEILEVGGHKVKKLSDSSEVVKEVSKSSYDMMFLSDIIPPYDFESEDIVRKIKDSSPKTQVVLVSSYYNLLKLKKLKEEGKIFDFLMKPFDYKTVIKIVNNLISSDTSEKEGFFFSKENLKYNRIRRHWRINHPVSVDYVVWNPDRWAALEKFSGVATTKNISPIGVCISIPYFVKPDFVSAISFTFTELKKYACATGEVVWAKAEGNYCDVGIEFTSIDKESESCIIEYMNGAQKENA